MSDQRSSAERVDHVLQSILASITPITQSEWLPILDASGRVLAQDVVAPESLPASPVSAMDGYALSSTGAVAKPRFRCLASCCYRKVSCRPAA